MAWERFRRNIASLLARWRAAHGEERPIRIGLAVSGGPDSTVLAVLWRRFVAASPPASIETSVLHVHHGLRGEDARADLALAREVAARFGWPFLLSERNVLDVRRREGGSIETVARAERFDAFEEWVSDPGLDAILTGHHDDDQVETIVDRLLRGTGIRGLAGIRRWRPLAKRTGAELWHPLLGLQRDELDRILADAGIVPRHDHSNDDLGHRRNWIRHEVLPKLEQHSPRLRHHLLDLARDAERVRADLESRVEPLVATATWHPDLVTVPLAPIVELPPTARAVLVAPLLDRLWARVTGAPTGLVRDHYDHWEAMFEHDGPAEYQLPDDWRVERAGGRVAVFRTPEPVARKPVELLGRRPVRVPWAEATFAPTDGESDPGDPWSWGPDPTATSPLWIRPPERGDRLGQGDWHADVHELLREHGIPKSLRATYPVVADAQNHPLWLPGIRSGRPAGPDAYRFEPHPGSRLEALIQRF